MATLNSHIKPIPAPLKNSFKKNLSMITRIRKLNEKTLTFDYAELIHKEGQSYVKRLMGDTTLTDGARVLAGLTGVNKLLEGYVEVIDKEMKATRKNREELETRVRAGVEFKASTEILLAQNTDLALQNQPFEKVMKLMQQSGPDSTIFKAATLDTFRFRYELDDPKNKERAQIVTELTERAMLGADYENLLQARKLESAYNQLGDDTLKQFSKNEDGINKIKAQIAGPLETPSPVAMDAANT